MTPIEELMKHALVSRLLQPAAFRFTEPDKPCAYWSSGDHIVANGLCRCGKKFDVLERE